MTTGGTQSNCYLETPNTNVAFFFKQKYASLQKLRASAL